MRLITLEQRFQPTELGNDLLWRIAIRHGTAALALFLGALIIVIALLTPHQLSYALYALALELLAGFFVIAYFAYVRLKQGRPTENDFLTAAKATIDRLGIKDFALNGPRAIYLDTLDYTKAHPYKWYSSLTLDHKGLLLCLLNPAFGAAYLFLTEKASIIRIPFGLLLTGFQIIALQLFIIQATGPLFRLFIVPFFLYFICCSTLATIPTYLCAKCSERVYSRSMKCNKCLQDF